MSEPTIVAASLSDSELRESINSLVNYVNKSVGKMAESFNTSIEAMEARLKALGRTNLDSNGSSTGGTSRSVKQQEELAKAVSQVAEANEKSSRSSKEKSMTMDKEQEGIRKSIDLSSKETEELQRQNKELKEHQERVQAIAQQAREAFSRYPRYPYDTGLRVDGQKAYVWNEKIDRANGLSIEQQIEALLVKQNESLHRQSELSAAITQEEQKRKKYIAPSSIEGYDRVLNSVMKSKINQDFIGSPNGAAIKQLNGALNQLSDTYMRLTAEERNNPFGQEMRRHMQELQRQIHVLRSEMNRPVSLNEILSAYAPKTLDDMAYKMQRLQAYRQGIDLTKPNAANEIRQVDDAMKKLQSEMDKYMVKSKQVGEINNALSRSWNYMKNRLAFYFTVGASTQFVKQLIEVRSQYELNERALGILIGSAERGTQIFNELSQMALVSPYTLIELSSAAKQLTAYDIAAKDVVDTTRRLADMASAVGVPMERLTYALGQIKAYGYLNSRDARMFANAGIPLVKQLSDYYTQLEGRMVSVGDVYDRMKKKTIGFNEVMSVINQMTDEGGKFFDFQAKMADTLKVRLANLTLAWNNMLNDIGKSEQGVLTTGIGALRDLFLRWKDLDTALKRIALTFGTLKAAQLLWYFAVRNTNKAIALEAVLGQKLATVARTLAASLRTLAFNPLTWIGVAVAALGSFVVAAIEGNTAMKEFNKTLREDAKGNYENIEQFLDGYRKLRNSLYETKEVTKDVDGVPTTYRVTTPRDINEDEANKAWEAVREQIELTTKSSDEYIARLMQIDNVSERLRQSFDILDEVKAVSAALKDLGDDGITITREWNAWWNLWLASDGLIVNLKDYTERLSKITDETQYTHWASMDEARKEAENGSRLAQKYVEAVDEAQQRFRKDLELTTESIQRFIEVQGWLGDETKINEAYKQLTESLINKNGISPEEAYQLQVEMEEARSKAAKAALEARLADMRAAMAIEADEEKRAAIQNEIEKEQARLDVWEQYNGRNKTEWERFTNEIKAYHISEMTAMFRGMDKEQIKSLNFQEGEYKDWVDRMAASYAKRHKMSIDEVHQKLKDFIYDANRYSIFIPLTISTEDKKSVYEQLGEYDKIIDDANKQIERLKTRIKELNDKQNKTKEETEELANANKELAQAEKDKAEAEAKGGHGKKESKDAAKAAKAAESELQKTLKSELQLIDKVRSTYKELTKEGLNSQDAIFASTNGFGRSVANINKVLGKWGIKKLDLAKFAGLSNPRELLDMLTKQLDELVKKGAKPSEIQDFEVKIRDVKVDVEKYDLDKITKGLNSQLDKLKEEYELAVELDSDPELGEAFMSFFDIDPKALPQNIDEYATRIVEELNKALEKRNSDFRLPNLNLTNDDLNALFEESKKGDGLIDQKSFEDIKKSVLAIRELRKKDIIDTQEEWNKLLDKYAEYERRRLQITKETENELRVARKKGASDEILSAIEKRGAQNLAKLDFEEFQKSPDWIVATGNLSTLSRDALRMLINEIEKYKRTATNLEPKQIEKMNKALRNLYKEVRKGNPFTVLRDSAEEAREISNVYQYEIDRLEKEQDDIMNRSTSGLSPKDRKRLDDIVKELDALIKKQGEVGKLSFDTVIKSTQVYINLLGDVASAFQRVADVTDKDGDKIVSQISTIVSEMSNLANSAYQGYQTFGGWWGALIGSAVEFVPKLIEWSNAYKNVLASEEYEKPEDAAKRLEVAYVDLEHAVERAYGTSVVGAKRATAAAKDLQLQELKRQLLLEQNRTEKQRDMSRIYDLERQIKELYNEINDMIRDITNDLLGSDVGSFAENLVSSMIQAFKQGEDYMKVFEDKFDELIDNMIMKSITSRVVSMYLDKLWGDMEERIDARTKAESQNYVNAQAQREQFEQYGSAEGWVKAEYGTAAWKNTDQERMQQVYQQILEYYRRLEEEALNALNEVSEITNDDINWLMDSLSQTKGDLANSLEGILGKYYTFGQDAKGQELSALQQGIRGITEDTAGAIESYLNGMSQQVYLHSDLLTQIRDTIQSWSMNENIGVQAQMLLQLQQSFQVQQSIESILQSVLNPSGRAFSVELLS